MLRGPGPILLISCYELGHQPLAVASAAAFLERAGYTPDTLDISVESFEMESTVRARFVGISVPMHTALRLGVALLHEDPAGLTGWLGLVFSDPSMGATLRG